jgi:hypothetical protein
MSQAMKNSNRNSLRALLALALCVAGLTGCAGDPLVTGDGAPLFGPDATPLPTASAEAIDMAPDCAGRLGNISGSQLSFEVASLSAGLVAVVNGSGEVICVDSVSDVTSDLDATGQSEAANAVVEGFLAAVHQADGHNVHLSSPTYGGDPEPQPNVRGVGALPDPEPQPN